MREACGCGAWIRGRRKDVLTWRTTHHHAPKAEPEPQGQRGGGSDITTAWRPGFTDDSERVIPDIQARIGFTPNGTVRSATDGMA